jgi:cytidine deaminase
MDLGYRVPKQEIRLSKLIEELIGQDFSLLSDDKRVDNLMDEGTRIREKAGHGGAVAMLALAGIDRVRQSEFKGEAERNAYVLHSLKRPEEIETLRNIYGRYFFAISVYAPRESRVDALAARITRSKHLNSLGARSEAERLIEKDETEAGKSLGQNVKDAFPTSVPHTHS